MNNPLYLGDGLYSSYDGHQFRLYTNEGTEVFLEQFVLSNFLKFVSKELGVKIEVTPNEKT